MLCIIINHTSSYIVLLYFVQFLLDESVTSPFFSLMYCTVTFTTHYLFFYFSFLNSFSVFSSYSSNSSHSLSLHPLLSSATGCLSEQLKRMLMGYTKMRLFLWMAVVREGYRRKMKTYRCFVDFLLNLRILCSYITLYLFITS